MLDVEMSEGLLSFHLVDPQSQLIDWYSTGGLIEKTPPVTMMQWHAVEMQAWNSFRPLECLFLWMELTKEGGQRR